VLSGNHLELKNITGEKVVKLKSEYQGKENVIIEDLVDCEVFLPFSIKCLYMKNVKSCKIYVGVCSGASFFDHVTDSKIMIQSH
jgi:hypoxanthine-guanine phosphoribosyltransferase